MTRPVTETTSPVWVSGPSASASYASTICASVCVRLDDDGIGLLAAVDELLALVETHPHLLGEVVLMGRGLGRVAHEDQA